MPGVFVVDGMSVRVPAGALKVWIGDDGEPTGSMSVELLVDVWQMWLDISIEHAEIAGQARRALELMVAGRPANERGSDVGRLLAEECRAGLVAITAAGFALDNLFSLVREFVPGIEQLESDWRSAKTARHRRISEALRRTFSIGNAGAKELHQRVASVFRIRDLGVHPPGHFMAPMFHPVLDSGVEPRFVIFGAPNAVAACYSAAAIIHQCIRAPRSTVSGLDQWCEGRLERSALLSAKADDLRREYLN
jgi:hypothetical protein